MSSGTLSPLPSAAPRESRGDFKPLPQFRSALPVSGNWDGDRWFPPLVVIPSVPAAPPDSSENFSARLSPPIASLPASPQPGRSAVPGALPEIILPPEPEKRHEVAGKKEDTDPKELPFHPVDFSDEDLAEAFAPIVGSAVRQAVFESERGNLDSLLEPMLRATVRRALAEYSPSTRPFESPGFVDRTVWRMQALFSSRSYEDVLFEKTHRFQVEEVFLFDARSLAMVSFASCDPARHSVAKRVESAAKRIALQIRTDAGEIVRSVERPDGRNVITEKGKHVVLAAIVRGSPNELVLADLSFSLRRIEEHFAERFEQAGSALMHSLQPFLEDCLLIQSPASAA